MLTALARYPGAKSGSGVYQTIINAMPPHRVYVEAFLGSGAILRRKRPAEYSIGIDIDDRVVEAWRTVARAAAPRTLLVEHGDARSIIASLGDRIQRDWLIYADPPYVRQTRRSARDLYRYEYTDLDHRVLLEQLAALPCLVMVSGYRSPLYDAMLATWRRIDFRAMTRGGTAIESLWCNFPAPEELHDYSYTGADYRERERIKRKKLRWARRIAAMPPVERAALLEALLEQRRGERCAPADITTDGEPCDRPA